MSTVHVVPLRDLVAHDVPGGTDGHDDGSGPWLCIEADGQSDDMECHCHPAVELVPNDTGPDGWMVTHHSLDGRELKENA